VIAILIASPQYDLGFGLKNLYERRFASRDVFIQGSLMAYFLSILSNCFVAFLMFNGIVKHRIFLCVTSALIALALFYILGTKAVFAYCLLAALLAHTITNHKISKLSKLIFVIFFVLFVIYIFERIVFNHSLVAQLIYRRFFVVPGEVMQHYLQMMTTSNSFDIVDGTDFPRGVTYYIGKLFYFEDQNVNTNAFFYAIASRGIFGYANTLFLAVVFFKLLDRYFKKTRDLGYLFIGFFYSIIITEQAVPTALVSSGFAFLFIILLFTVSKKIIEI
jgi:hypothetical protein